MDCRQIPEHRRDALVSPAKLKRYEGKVKSGSILLSVHAEDGDEVKRAKEIFKQHRADDIAYTGESSVAREDRADQGKPPYPRHPGVEMLS